MSLMKTLLGQDADRASMNQYEELDLEQYESDIEAPDLEMEVHIAELRGQEGVMDVKDLVYDGDLVIADVSFFRTSDARVERIIEEFRQVAEEVGGDIVQKGDNQLIISPAGVGISREKISR